MKKSELRNLIREEVRKVLALNESEHTEWVTFRDSNGKLDRGEFKKQPNGKWLEISNSRLSPQWHGIEKLLGKTKKEHEEKLKELSGFNDNYSNDLKKIHKYMIKKLSDKELSDKDIENSKKATKLY